MSEEELDNVINSLSKLELKLLKYNKYLAADRSLDFDLSKISKENIDKKLVMICVQKVLKILHKIDKDDISFEYLENLINHFYYIAYGLMGRELLFSEDSLIYNYITSDKTKMDIIRKYIKDDYDDIRQLMLDEAYDDNTNELLAHFMFNIEINDEEIFDKKVIRMIARIDPNNKNFISKINEQFNFMFEDLERHIAGIEFNVQNKDEISKDVSNLEKLKEARQKEMKKRGISTALSLVILGCTYFGASNSFKQNNIDKSYKGTVTTYSSIDKEPKKSDMLFDINDDIESNVKLNIYSKAYNSGLFNMDKVRTMETYDVSNYYYTNLDKYLDIDLSDLQYSIKETPYVTGASTEKYFEVVKTEIDKSEIIENVNTFDCYSKLFAVLLAIEVILDIITKFRENGKYNPEKIYTGLIFNIYKMFCGDYSIQSSIQLIDAELKKNMKQIKDYDNSIQNLLSEYKEKYEEFVKLKYKYILVNRDTLLVSINKREEENIKVKELIRSKLHRGM